MKPMGQWTDYESRIEADIDRIITVLDGLQTTCTFFVLGWIAEHHPTVVHSLVAAGHEVATHGYGHVVLDQQTRDEFTADLDRSIAAIEQAGSNVEGYRAPGFVSQTWLFEELTARGFNYDASVLPGRWFNGALPSAGRAPFQLPSGLWEFPYSIVKCLGAELPIFGGGYLRITPHSVLASAIRRQNRAGLPVVLYFHPREWDPAPPETGLTGFTRWRRNVNLAASRTKVTRLIEQFEFTSIREAMAALEQS